MSDHDTIQCFLPGGKGIVRTVLRGRHPAFLLLTVVISAISVFPAIADVRFVPQLTLTSLDPVTVAFHPTNSNVLMVLNRDGRIDILNLDWGINYSDNCTCERPIKRLEISSGAHAAAFSPDGKYIASGGEDGKVRLWDVEGGKQKDTVLQGHESSVQSVAVSPKGKYIVSGGEDGTVILWDVEGGNQKGLALQGHKGSVLSVAFSPEGKYIVSGGEDDTVRLWDVEGGKQKDPVLNHDWVSSVAFSFDGKYIASGGRDGRDGTVRLWDAKSGEPMGMSLDHGDSVSSVAFSPDGQRIVSGADDGTVRLWDIESGETIGALLGYRRSVPVLQKRNGQLVRSVAFSFDGKYIASGGEDGTVRLWDAKSPTQIGALKERHKGSVWTVAFSPDGHRIVSGGDGSTVRLWDAKSGEPTGMSLDHGGLVRRVAFSPKGQYIASGGEDGTVRLWDAKSGEPMGMPLDHGDSVSSVAFSPDGQRIVSGGEDGTVRLWDAKSGEPMGMPLDHGDSVWSVAFSPDGKRIVSGGEDGTVRLWDAKSGEPMGMPLDHGDSVWSVAFSPDGKYIASGGDGGKVRLWYAKSGEPKGEPFEGHDGWAWDVAFSPDGKYIASSGGEGTVILWDVETGKAISAPLVAGYRQRILSVAFSPDGKGLVTGTEEGRVQLWYVEGGREVSTLTGRKGFMVIYAFSPDGKYTVWRGLDNSMSIWDMESGTAIGKPLEGHEGLVRRVAFSPKGQYIASGGRDGTVRLWDAKSGEPMGMSLDHGDSVWSVAFSPKGKYIVSGGRDGAVRLWDVESRKAKGAPKERHKGSVLSVAFSPKGKYIASGGRDGTVRLWDAKSGEPMGMSLDHGDSVSSVAFSPKGKYIVSGGRDGTVRLWDVESRKAKGALKERHKGSVWTVAFSPDGQRIVSGGDDGTVRLWDVANRTPEKSAPICQTSFVGVRGFPRNVFVGLPREVFVIRCNDRLTFLNSDLDHLGDVFLHEEGLVAVAGGQGVYVSSPLLEDHILPFRDEESVSRKLISTEEFRQILFNNWSIWSLLRLYAEEATKWIKDIHDSLGPVAFPVWFTLIWVLVVLWALAMWALFPARLARLSMPKAGGQSLPPGNSRSWQHVVGVVTLFVWLGRKRRPLRKWLQKNRGVLEKVCFTERVPVKEREKYLPIGHEDTVNAFEERIARNERGLVWIEGVGGSGKSAFAMYMLRKVLIGKSSAPVPVFVGEDWSGSLAAQVSQQLRHPDWTRFPTEAMIKTLGACGLICPLVDSLSERGMDDALGCVKNSISNRDFQHLVVTSRESRPGDQAWQAVKQVTPCALVRNNVTSFIEVYLPEADPIVVQNNIAPLLVRGRMPSPLFLRFAIEQAAKGPLKAVHHSSLVLDYVEALRFDKIDINNEDMRRAAGIAAIESVQEHLRPQEISAQQLRLAFLRESNANSFYDKTGNNEVTPANLVEMLIQSGLINRGTKNLQFAYDPVADILTPWWVTQATGGEYDTLLKRIDGAAETEVGRAYREILAENGEAQNL